MKNLAFERCWLNSADELMRHANDLVAYMVNNSEPTIYKIEVVGDLLLVDNCNGFLELVDAEDYFDVIEYCTREIIDVERLNIMGVTTVEHRRHYAMPRSYTAIQADIRSEVFKRMGKLKTYHNTLGEGSMGPDAEDLLIGLDDGTTPASNIDKVFEFFGYDLPSARKSFQALQDAEKKALAPGLVEVE